ncbi:MAG: hypothetical protein DSM106950_39625 [Stigonema ocellatum SAG 48.90 = DSM 106950]|nr:hypothetical protein [Stigonema ocellatum SAG 48.90 = DSM 106950]
MLKSAIVNKPLDPNLNVNLGCHLKWKPADDADEEFCLAEFLRSITSGLSSQLCLVELPRFPVSKSLGVGSHPAKFACQTTSGL